MNKKIFLGLSFLLLLLSTTSFAQTPIELARLQDAYPDLIQEVSSKHIVWKNGTRLRVEGSYSLLDQIGNLFSHENNSSEESVTLHGLQCDRYEIFFRKMYGGSYSEVRKNLVTIYWLPKIYGKRYPLQVTTINDVNKKLQRISAALEKLPRSYYKYLVKPGGSFYWRNVAREKYLSTHSFGIAIDINSHYGNYWLWDWESGHRKQVVTIEGHNRIPKEIIDIFEKEGFLWGGRWAYYDTMHFEYRPELFTKTDSGLKFNNPITFRCTV